MSRIFDALRKSEAERAAGAEFPPSAAASGSAGPSAPGWREIAASAAPQGEFVDRLPALRSGSVKDSDPAAWTGPGEECFRVLVHRLEMIRRQRPLGKLLVTSAVPQEGKTTVAAHLAAALARGARRVLLVDGDLRHPGLDRELGLPRVEGLGEWLDGRGEFASLARRVEPFGFAYLAAGRTGANPAEALARPALAEFLASATATFDWVVLDSPPVVPFADARRLSTLADGVLLVLRQGVTPRAAIAQSFAALDRAFIAGAVVNGARDDNRGYYRYYDSGRGAWAGREREPRGGRAA